MGGLNVSTRTVGGSKGWRERNGTDMDGWGNKERQGLEDMRAGGKEKPK